MPSIILGFLGSFGFLLLWARHERARCSRIVPGITIAGRGDRILHRERCAAGLRRRHCQVDEEARGLPCIQAWDGAGDRAG